MKKIIGFFLLLTLHISAQEKINILFIGNSLTYFHDMPKTLQFLLNENSEKYNVEQSTFPGMTLDSHLSSIIVKKDGESIETRTKETGEITETEKKITSRKWDIVILQENPGNQYFPEIVKEVTIPTIEKIKSLVNNNKCKFIIFNTWLAENKQYPIKSKCVPKHYFDWERFYVNEEVSNNIKVCSPEIINDLSELKILTESYKDLLIKDNFNVTNHPNLHYKFKKNYPDLKLYDDDYHPSELGSFLNACVFYKIITNKKLKKLKYSGIIDKSSTRIIKTFTDLNLSNLK